jgi:hypothetical protein
MKKINYSFFGGLLLALVAILFGATGGVCMAEAAITPLPDAGKTVTGSEGGMTITAGMEAVPELYMSDVDKRITKMRPMASPIDQISRYATALKAEAMEVKFYSTSTRPIKTTLQTAIARQTTGTSVVLAPEDANMFTDDDTIRVVGQKGYIDGDETKPSDEDLVLHVAGIDETTGNPAVYAVNGLKDTGGQTTFVPAITAGTTLIRMGKACAEIDAQTAKFFNIPTPESQYCQNFMMQVEESTFDKITLKEADWNFSDIEEDGIYDMRVGQENSYLFGAKKMLIHPRKKNATWFTGGIWWMAGRDITIGTWDGAAGVAVIQDDQLIDVAREMFTGTETGSKRKVLFAGSGLLAALSKIKSEKFTYKESVEVWNLKFKSFDTDFGEVLVMHHDLFDQNGMENEGLAMDPNYLTKKTFISFDSNALDLKNAGVRNTQAKVLQEVCCLYLRYKNAHARIKLASA